MTREEAIENVKELIDTYITCHGEEDIVAVSLDNVDVEALDMANKALEQGPILDKVRAEMLEEMLSHSGTGDEVVQAYADGLHNALRIIDKHKGESEEV